MSKASWVGKALAAAGMLVLTTVTAAVPATAANPLSVPTSSGCPAVDGKWADTGPFDVTEEHTGEGHTIYRPTELAAKGCTKNPVIIWGNGTFATPVVYDKLMRHFASHGFVVAAADTTQSGSGAAMLAGIDYLAKRNEDAGSVYYHKVDLDKIGAAGHSQGGGGAINAGEDARVKTVIPLQPGPQGTVEKVKGSMFFLAGSADIVVIPGLLVHPRFLGAGHTVAEYGELKGATHFTSIGDAGGFRGPMTAWFRFELLGDEQARGEFFGPGCGNCADPAWTRFERNARAAQVPGPDA